MTITITLLDKLYPFLKLPWKKLNFNRLSINEKRKLGKSLIKSKNIQVNRKIITYPFQNIDEKTFVRKVNLQTQYDTSYLNIYKYLQLIWRKPVQNLKPLTFPPRKSTTYQYKLSLKSKNNSYGIDLILFQAGFARSIQESRHYIKQGYIKINGRDINNIKYIPRNGDIIKNYHPTSLFTYFNQKYLGLMPFNNLESKPFRRFQKKKKDKDIAIKYYMVKKSKFFSKAKLFLKKNKIKKNKVRMTIGKKNYYRLHFNSQPEHLLNINFNEVLYLK